MLAELGSFCSLESLSIPLASGQSRFLAGLKRLRTLQVVQRGSGHLNLSGIAGLPHVEELILENVSLCEQDVDVILRLPNLRFVVITAWEIDKFMPRIQEFRKKHPNVKVETGAFTLNVE
jgi:hypothetical protein